MTYGPVLDGVPDDLLEPCPRAMTKVMGPVTEPYQITSGIRAQGPDLRALSQGHDSSHGPCPRALITARHMTKVMSLTAVMALLAQGGAPNPKIPIPQRPLESHVDFLSKTQGSGAKCAFYHSARGASSCGRPYRMRILGPPRDTKLSQRNPN